MPLHWPPLIYFFFCEISLYKHCLQFRLCNYHQICLNKCMNEKFWNMSKKWFWIPVNIVGKRGATILSMVVLTGITKLQQNSDYKPWNGSNHILYQKRSRKKSEKQASTHVHVQFEGKEHFPSILKFSQFLCRHFGWLPSSSTACLVWSMPSVQCGSPFVQNGLLIMLGQVLLEWNQVSSSGETTTFCRGRMAYHIVRWN